MREVRREIFISEKGEVKREKGEGRREKGKGTSEKGEVKRRE